MTSRQEKQQQDSCKIITSQKWKTKSHSPIQIQSKKKRMLINIATPKNTQRLISQESKKFSSQKMIVENFIQTKFSQQNSPKQRLSIGTQSFYIYHSNKLMENIKKDDLLKECFNQVSDTNIMKMLLQIIRLTDYKLSTIRKNDLQATHQSLSIGDREFNQLKYLFIKQMIQMKLESKHFLQCVADFEKFRSCIQGEVQIDFIEQLFSLIFLLNQVDHQVSIKSHSQYTNFEKYFNQINKQVQSEKFSKIICQMIQTDQSPFYSLDKLRQKHIRHSYKINAALFSQFKYYFYKCAQQQKKVTQKSLCLLLEIMDTYKPAIINQDSIKDLIENKCNQSQQIQNSLEGLNNFIEEFNSICYKDSRLVKLIKERGRDKMRYHSYNLFEYFFQLEKAAFHKKDLSSIHQKIEPQTFEALQQNAYSLIKRLNPHPIVFQDFQQQWDNFRPHILNQDLPYQKVGGWEQVDKIEKEMLKQLLQDQIFESFYSITQKCPKQYLKQELQFLLSGQNYFKRIDIKIIHEHLNISHALFNNYLQCLQNSIVNVDGNQLWIVDLANEWRKLIVL